MSHQLNCDAAAIAHAAQTIASHAAAGVTYDTFSCGPITIPAATGRNYSMGTFNDGLQASFTETLTYTSDGHIATRTRTENSVYACNDLYNVPLDVLQQLIRTHLPEYVL